MIPAAPAEQTIANALAASNETPILTRKDPSQIPGHTR